MSRVSTIYLTFWKNSLAAFIHILTFANLTEQVELRRISSSILFLTWTLVLLDPKFTPLIRWNDIDVCNLVYLPLIMACYDVVFQWRVKSFWSFTTFSIEKLFSPHKTGQIISKLPNSNEVFYSISYFLLFQIGNNITIAFWFISPKELCHCPSANTVWL